ncbi:MAG: hypothetical protein QOH97_3650 [Actinoplanes sp.]|jgi:hypothetical protein|nr:hypothetical protein [Actinoplanes sp.]
MLTEIQQQAIIHCLTGIDTHTQRTHAWPGPNLLAVLCETPVPGHPDPTARRLSVNPAPVAPGAWHHPDGPIAALREEVAALHNPVILARLATATGNRRLQAWVFMHTDVVIDDESGPQQVRYIDAVDLDDRTYILTRLPRTPTGLVTVHAPGETDNSGVIQILRALARNLRTH